MNGTIIKDDEKDRERHAYPIDFSLGTKRKMSPSGSSRWIWHTVARATVIVGVSDTQTLEHSPDTPPTLLGHGSTPWTQSRDSRHSKLMVKTRRGIFERLQRKRWVTSEARPLLGSSNNHLNDVVLLRSAPLN
ncbi:hypothetical protein GBA52_004785 [Prunus armeniaca]|nr:hypothetical protein GBA52_004785 [Prunus armeniaca]